MDYDEYYEQEFQGETLVTVNYDDPEPSLFRVAKGQRPKMAREYSPTSQMRPKLRAARKSYSRPYRQQQRNSDNIEDYRDDEMNFDLSSRGSDRGGDRSESSRPRNSDRTLGSQTSGSSQRSRQRMTNTSQRSNNSSSKAGSKKTIDLTTPESDSSFSLFASLLAQHIEPKVEGNEYILEAGDMTYLEAIIPESLRLPFVEAVRIRSGRLSMKSSANDTELEAAVRKCAELGIGNDNEDNFLLGGGEKLKGGKILMRVGNENSSMSEKNDDADRVPAISEAEALAQVEAAFGRRDKAISVKQNSSSSKIETPMEVGRTRRVQWDDEEDKVPSEPLRRSKTPEAKKENLGQTNAISAEEARAQIAAAYKKMGKKSSKKKQKADGEQNEEVTWSPKDAMAAELMKNANQIHHVEATRDGYQPPMEIMDDQSLAMSSLGGSVYSESRPPSRQSLASSSRKSLASSNKSSKKLPKPNNATRNVSSGSILGSSELLNKEALLADTLDEESPVKEPIFDVTVKKTEEAEARARERRKKKKRRSRKTQSCVAGTISVNTSPSDLDMTIAAFEHEWRDGLWDIFAHGVFHPHLFLSFVAPIFALGQVMTRLKLNWVGASSCTNADTLQIFQKIGTLVGCLAAIDITTISLSTCLLHIIPGLVEFLLFVCVMANFCFYGFCVFITGNTRKYLRGIYNINDTAESDYLLAAFYMPFTIAQMLRHTADYNSLQARICTPSGLSKEADFSFIANVATFGSYGSGSYASFNDEEVSVAASKYTGNGSVSASVGGATYETRSATSSYYTSNTASYS